jgi:hypothetical protein
MLLAALVLAGGCGNDLPAANFIDKLRVLAVQAEPPEVTPGQSTALDVLAVEPLVQQLDGAAPSALSYLWLACNIPPGASEQLPCGLSLGQRVTGALPPDCRSEPGASLCVIGTDRTGSYVPAASQLNTNGTGQVLLTVVVADTPEGAIGCLTGAANNNAQPTNPDHCVLSLKRLAVSDPNRRLSDGSSAPPPNRNPALNDFTLDEQGAYVSLTDGTGTYAIAPTKDAKSFPLAVARSEDASEMAARFDPADGRFLGYEYESLTVAWFITAGKLSGGRSAFKPDGCSTQTDCPQKAPGPIVSVKWTPPTAEMAGKFTTDGTAQFYAVIRDDRGGVSWREGTLKQR